MNGLNYTEDEETLRALSTPFAPGVAPDTPAELASTEADESSPDVEPVDGPGVTVGEGPSGITRPLRPDDLPDEQPLASGSVSPATRQPGAPTERPVPSGGGFDLSRAIHSAAGGNMAEFDAHRLAKEEAPLRRAEMEAKLGERKLKSQELREAIDPNSSTSKAAAEGYIRQQMMLANALPSRFASLAEHIRSTAASAKGQSAARIAQMSKQDSPVLDLIRKFSDSESRAALASQGKALQERGVVATEKLADSTISDRKSDNALQREKFNFEKGQSLANKFKVHLTGDQQKLVGEMAGDLNQIRVIEKIAPMADKYAETASEVPGAGKSGPISGRLQTLKSKFKRTTDKDYNDFRATVQRLFSVERKFFAGVAVSKGEMENLAPMIPDFNNDSEATIRDKLNSAREYLKTKTDTNMSRLQYGADGQPLDQSLLVRMISGQAPKSAAENPAIIEAASGGAAGAGKPTAAAAAKPAPNGQRVKQGGVWFAWDGTKYVKEK